MPRWRIRKARLGDFGPVTAVIACGLVLSAIAFFLVRAYYFSADRHQFQSDAAFYGANFRGSIDHHVNSLAAIHAFVSASHKVDRWEFSNFARQVLPENSGLKAVLWVPEVASAERRTFEARMQSDGLFGLTIRELRGNGKLVAAPPRQTYLPVAYVEPFEVSGTLIGVDLGRNDIYAPLFAAARAKGQIVSSPPLDRTLVDGAHAPFVMLAFPLARENGKGLEGYVLGVVELDRVIGQVLSHRAPVKAAIAFRSRNGLVVYRDGVRASLRDFTGTSEFRQIQSFRIADRVYYLVIASAPSATELTRVYVPAGLALLVLALTALLAQSMLVTALRKLEVERAVLLRTAELRRINRSLGAEIEQRLKAQGALIVARDKAETANRAKSAFLATMSHELRTPLNAIIGFSGMLLDGAVKAAAKKADYLKEINGAGFRLLDLINDILEITQMDAAANEAHEPVYLSDVVAGVAEKMRKAADEAGMTLATAVGENLPPIKGDGRRLERAAVHLVSNAIKFGRKGGAVRITARALKYSQLLEVRDDGPGLPEGSEDSILELFAQGDTSLSRHRDGVGLGLTFVCRVANHHEARLKVESRKGKGTSISMVFPPSRIGALDKVA